MSQTVTDPTPYQRKFQMSALGWVVAIGTALMLLPLAPFLLALWVLSRVIETRNQAVRSDVSAGEPR